MGECGEFEWLENHEHLLDHVSKAQFRSMRPVLDSLCRAMRDALAARYPDRKFHVWGLLQLHGTMMVRFLQEWPGEAPFWTDDMAYDRRSEFIVHYSTGAAEENDTAEWRGIYEDSDG